jgi:hypothetical protein
MWKRKWIGDCIQKHSYFWNIVTSFPCNFWHALFHQIWNLSKVEASTKSYFQLFFSSKWRGRNSMAGWWHAFLHHKKILIGLIGLIGLVVNSTCTIPKYAFSLEIDFVYIALSFLSIEVWVLEYHNQWGPIIKHQGFWTLRKFNSKLWMRHVTSRVKPVPMERTDSKGDSWTT